MSLETGASERLLIYAPLGRDNELLLELAKGAGFEAIALKTLDELNGEFEKDGAGAIVLTEESMHRGQDRVLANLAECQPDWSDLPFIVLASRAGAEERTSRIIALSKPLRNVTFIERPVKPANLVSAFEVVLRDRRRQYELRNLLARYRSLHADLEQRVTERTRQLVDANREMEGFTYSVSHDLRAPLRAISSTSMILKEDFGHLLPQEALSQLDRQSAASGKLAALIDDLLRLSRLSRQELDRKSIDLSELVSDVAGEVSSRVRTHVRFEIQPNVTVSADPTLLRLAILNLIENAVKFSPQGGEVRFGSENGVHCISDQGIGFNPQYSNKIFQPFERLVTDRDFPGTGIGLANVHRIVSKHDGKIWVESTPEKGSSFYFTLGPSPGSTMPAG